MGRTGLLLLVISAILVAGVIGQPISKGPEIDDPCLDAIDICAATTSIVVCEVWGMRNPKIPIYMPDPDTCGNSSINITNNALFDDYDACLREWLSYWGPCNVSRTDPAGVCASYGRLYQSGDCCGCSNDTYWFGQCVEWLDDCKIPDCMIIYLFPRPDSLACMVWWLNLSATADPIIDQYALYQPKLNYTDGNSDLIAALNATTIIEAVVKDAFKLTIDIYVVFYRYLIFICNIIEWVIVKIERIPDRCPNPVECTIAQTVILWRKIQVTVIEMCELIIIIIGLLSEVITITSVEFTNKILIIKQWVLTYG